MESENTKLLEFISKSISLNNKYFDKLTTLGLKYNRSETLDLLEEYQNKQSILKEKFKY